ncbi:molybdate ABC transporter substrate-binding protein [soil metagenome]
MLLRRPILSSLPGRAVYGLLCLLLLGGCIGDDGNSEGDVGDAPGTLTVAAAADLQFAFTEIGERFEEETGWAVTFSFGSTGNLAAQIEQGAPFDVYAAANIAFVEDLMRQDLLIAETEQRYAIGRVVLAVNRDSGVSAMTLEDLLDPEIRQVAIANPDHAPYGLAAREALESAGIWDELRPKIVYGENVRQTLQFIQTGNAEAGMVALSIAEVPEISYTLIDEGMHNPLEQAMVVVAGTPHEQAAREFVAFVNGPEGREIMRQYGFSLPGEQ